MDALKLPKRLSGGIKKKNIVGVATSYTFEKKRAHNVGKQLCFQFFNKSQPVEPVKRQSHVSDVEGENNH